MLCPLPAPGNQGKLKKTARCPRIMPKNTQAIESPRNPQSLKKLGQKTSFENQLIAVATAPVANAIVKNTGSGIFFRISNLRVAMPIRAVAHNERKRNVRISQEIFNVFLRHAFLCSLSCR